MLTKTSSLISKETKIRGHYRKPSKKCQERCVETFLQQMSYGHAKQAKQRRKIWTGQGNSNLHDRKVRLRSGVPRL